MHSPVTPGGSIAGIIDAYDRKAEALVHAYEGVAAADVHTTLKDLIPPGPGLVLDIGAGSGRDAAWLASLGHDTVAVEPSAGMRRRGEMLHADRGLRWLDDRLPDLAATHRLGLSYDVILLSAVWMHVPPGHRARAFRKVATLLKPGGLILISLRNGPPDPERPMWPAPAGEIEALARAHGLAVVRSAVTPDRHDRPEISWTSLCLRLPDDGAGALPLLRGVILNDDKASTYKLGLLRAVARIADLTPGLAGEVPDEDAVEVPLGAAALHWVAMYLPLVAASLPQLPGNAGPDGLGFAGPGFRALAALGITARDLRIGAVFSGERARAVARALAEARSTIARMPANFVRYPNSDARVFKAVPSRTPRPGDRLVIDGAMLRAFGALVVPGHVWRAMQRLGAWIEPVLVAEWARLVRGYGDAMGRVVPPGTVEAALAWSDPERGVMPARQAAERLLRSGRSLRCVWTGVPLPAHRLDIDHCLPWSAWPCGDLWNLMPASRQVNQVLKRDRLPSASALKRSREHILAWWEVAWLADEAMADRFAREAAAALPVTNASSPEEVFSGLEWRRLRLQQDQQMVEWPGPSPGSPAI